MLLVCAGLLQSVKQHGRFASHVNNLCGHDSDLPLALVEGVRSSLKLKLARIEPCVDTHRIRSVFV